MSHGAGNGEASSTPSRKRGSSEVEKDTPEREEGNGDYTTVQGKRSKQKSDIDSPINMSGAGRASPIKTINNKNSAVFIVYIKAINTDITKKSPNQIKTEIVKKFGSVLKLEKAGSSIRISCVSRTQQVNILNCKALAGESIECSEPRQRVGVSSARFNKQIIFNVPLAVTDSEIVEGTGAISANRIVKRQGDARTPTSTVILSFQLDFIIPQILKIDYLSFRPKLYIPLPLRCFNCQTFGHHAATCRQTTPTCPICAGGHAYDKCPGKKGKPKCANCGGEHSAAFRQCPKFLHSQELTKVVISTGMSYKDALTKMRASIPHQSRNHAPTPLSPPLRAQNGPHPPPPSFNNKQAGLTSAGQSKVYCEMSTQTDPIIADTAAHTSTQTDTSPTLSEKEIGKIKPANRQVSYEDMSKFFTEILSSLKKSGTDRKVCGYGIQKAAADLFKLDSADLIKFKVNTVNKSKSNYA